MVKMSKNNCNLCLAVNRRTTNIMNTHLQLLYEKLANFKVGPKLNLCVCYLCHTRLRQCHRLSQLAKRTRCFLTTGLLHTNIKLKSNSMGAVNLSHSTMSHYSVPTPNTNTIVEVLVKREPAYALGELDFNNESFEQYDDIGNTDDWYPDDDKQYGKALNFGNRSYEDIKDVKSYLKNKVEIEINPHNTSIIELKRELVDLEIKKELIEDGELDASAAPDGVLYSCSVCDHMCATMSLLRKHRTTHATTKVKSKPTAPGKHRCPVCGKYYADRKTLMRHKKIHSALRPFGCEICGKGFTRRDHLNKHKRTHSGMRIYACTACNAHFPGSTELQAHRCPPRHPEAHPCDVCGESFERWDLYHAHKTEVHGITLFPEVTVARVGGENPGAGDEAGAGAGAAGADTPETETAGDPAPKQTRKTKPKFPCGECNTSYASAYRLESHVLAKHRQVDRTRYECSHCARVFLRRDNLLLHLRTHSDARRYCCDVCGKTFTYKSSLNVHRRVHTGAKPYACELCAKRFTAFGQLAEHRLVHSDERPFVCEVCNKAFKRRRHLKKHAMAHNGVKPYTCDVCFKTFGYNYNFVIHRRIHTGEKPFVCDVCGDGFSENRLLKKHKAIHGP